MRFPCYHRDRLPPSEQMLELLPRLPAKPRKITATEGYADIMRTLRTLVGEFMRVFTMLSRYYRNTIAINQ